MNRPPTRSLPRWMRRPLAAVLLAAASLGNLPSAALAVMIRHDVPDADYTNRAQASAFAASRLTLLTPVETTSGTLITPSHLITAGHLVAGWVPEGSNAAPCNLAIQWGTQQLTGVYTYLFPAYDRTQVVGGFDVAIVRLAEPLAEVRPATLWVGGVDLGQRFTGIGQGRTGTGLDNNEPGAGGVFRGYENTVDYLYDPAAYRHWRCDFDNGDPAYNSLAEVLYDTVPQAITGTSSALALPLEGTAAAGDSGSAVYVQKRSDWLLAGITSYRWYSQYGGQAGYVNLSAPEIGAWLSDVATAESTAFTCVTQIPALLRWAPESAHLLIEGNLDRPYRIEVSPSLLATDGWESLTNLTLTGFPCTVSLPTSPPPLFFRAIENP